MKAIIVIQNEHHHSKGANMTKKYLALYVLGVRIYMREV